MPDAEGDETTGVQNPLLGIIFLRDLIKGYSNIDEPFLLTFALTIDTYTYRALLLERLKKMQR